MVENLKDYDDINLYYLMNSKKKIAEKAFVELYNRYSNRVYNYCRCLLRKKEDAEDVCQETFEKFVVSLKENRTMTNVSAFLIKIAKNLCINYQRDIKKFTTYSEYTFPVLNTLENDELLKLIRAAVTFLPEDLKDIFILREYDGLSYTEITEITNIPFSMVRTRLYRARQKLKKILLPYLNDLLKNA